MKQSRTVTPLDNARKFDISELFFSTTDRKGLITACNDVFVRIAAFNSEDLLGAPHNIIRHPDMPRSVFKLLWDYLLSDRPIGAYVKNMAKTGEYYWVFALVIPIGDQYLSVRLKPTSNFFPLVKSLYSEVLKLENSYGSDWRKGMEESGKFILGKVTELGFESYDDFMAQALFQEVSSRRNFLGSQGQLGSPEEAIFENIGSLTELRKNLLDQNIYFKELGSEMYRLAINANVVAARLSERGRALAVISQEISRVANRILLESDKLAEEAEPLREVLGGVSFAASLSTLTSEMQLYFEQSCKESELSTADQIQSFGQSFEKLGHLLESSKKLSLDKCFSSLVLLKQTIRSFESFTRELSKILLNLQLGYVTGKSIAITIEGGDQFSLLLEAIVNFSGEARDRLLSLETSIKSVNHLANKKNEAETTVVSHL